MEKNSKSLLNDLINMVMADERITDSEVAFIQKLAKRMEISNKEVCDF